MTIDLAEQAPGAVQIALEVLARRNGMAAEDTRAAEFPSTAPTAARRGRDRAMVRGMLIALSMVIGEPNHLPRAEAFVERARTARRAELAAAHRGRGQR